MPNLELLLKRLVETGQTTHDYFASLDEAALVRVIFTNPDWTARDMLAHLITTERAIRPLILGIVSGEPGAPPGYDIDAANARLLETMRGLSSAELLTAWAAERTATVTAFAQLVPADLENRGRHPFLGETTVDDMIQLMYRHEMLHTRDVRRALGSAA